MVLVTNKCNPDGQIIEVIGTTELNTNISSDEQRDKPKSQT